MGGTDTVPYQGMVLRYPTEAPPLPSTVKSSAYVAFDVDDSVTGAAGPLPLRSVHVLTLQAHPEFNVAVTQNELSAIHAANEMDDALFKRAYEQAAAPNDGLETARALLTMLGVEPSTSDQSLDG